MTSTTEAAQHWTVRWQARQKQHNITKDDDKHDRSSTTLPRMMTSTTEAAQHYQGWWQARQKQHNITQDDDKHDRSSTTLPRMMTDLVPSPVSSSCVRATSISDLAAGCCTLICQHTCIHWFILHHTNSTHNKGKCKKYSERDPQCPVALLLITMFVTFPFRLKTVTVVIVVLGQAHNYALCPISKFPSGCP